MKSKIKIIKSREHLSYQFWNHFLSQCQILILKLFLVHMWLILILMLPTSLFNCLNSNVFTWESKSKLIKSDSILHLAFFHSKCISHLKTLICPSLTLNQQTNNQHFKYLTNNWHKLFHMKLFTMTVYIALMKELMLKYLKNWRRGI